MSIMDSGVVMQKLTPPEELPNPVEGQPLSAALKYIFDHTGFTGDLKKVLDYAVLLAAQYEAEKGEIVATEARPFEQPAHSNPENFTARHLPQAQRTGSDPSALNLPPGRTNPFVGSTNGMTTSKSLYRGDPNVEPPPVYIKPGLGANPDPTFDPIQQPIVVPPGGDATDPALAKQIERENKISPAERFKLETDPTPKQEPLIIIPEPDDPF